MAGMGPNLTVPLAPVKEGNAYPDVIMINRKSPAEAGPFGQAGLSDYSNVVLSTG